MARGVSGATSVAADAGRRRSSLSERMLERMFPGATTALAAAAATTTAGGVSTHSLLRKRELAASEPLQIALYYNALYSTLHLLLNVLLLRFKVLNSKDMSSITSVVLFSLWAFVEFSRLLLGFIGNIREKVQHVAAFFILSVIPQLLLVAYQTFLQPSLLPIDQISGGILLVFLLFEILLGYVAVKHIIRIQTTRFRLDFEDKLADMEPANLDLHYPAFAVSHNAVKYD